MKGGKASNIYIQQSLLKFYAINFDTPLCIHTFTNTNIMFPPCHNGQIM